MILALLLLNLVLLGYVVYRLHPLRVHLPDSPAMPSLTPGEEPPPETETSDIALHLVGDDGTVEHEMHLHGYLRPPYVRAGNKIYKATTFQFREGGAWMYREYHGHRATPH